MPIISEHLNPTTKQDCIDTWRKAGRISVPARHGHIVEVIIVTLYETTAANGIPLDLLIEAQTNRINRNTPYRSYGGRKQALTA